MKFRHRGAVTLALLLAGALAMTSEFAAAQTTYQPKFKGDPAHSDSEALALGYMRTVLRAQKLYYRKNNRYATSLRELVHHGSFTSRMVDPDRGDYTVGFHSKKDGFELTMTPKMMDAQHRSFYADESGTIRAEEDKAAGPDSPKIE